MKVKIAPNATTELKPIPYNKDNYELPVEKDDKLLALYNKGKFLADINSINGEGEEKEVRHTFRYERLSNREVTNKYEPFTQKWDAGEIEKAGSDKVNRAVDAENYDEPIRSMIIGTVGQYRGNLVRDIQTIFSEKNESMTDFINLYKNSPNDLQNGLEGLKNKSKITLQDIREVFKGYHAHHIIPANFLKNNETLKTLLSQPGISFNYNQIDNLVFLHPDNHLEEKMRSHPEYDSYIRKLIDGEVARLVNQGDFESAIDALHDIIENTKDKFIDDVIGSKNNINKF